MYSVQMQKTCKCFQKSDYVDSQTFKTQKEAYTYAKILTEIMNEEFCSTHTFDFQRVDTHIFLITLTINLHAIEGYRPHITCDVGCGSTDKWSLESTK